MFIASENRSVDRFMLKQEVEQEEYENKCGELENKILDKRVSDIERFSAIIELSGSEHSHREPQYYHPFLWVKSVIKGNEGLFKWTNY